MTCPIEAIFNTSIEIMGPSIGIGIGKYRFVFEVLVPVYIATGKVGGIKISVSVFNILHRYRCHNKKLLKTNNICRYIN